MKYCFLLTVIFLLLIFQINCGSDPLYTILDSPLKISDQNGNERKFKLYYHKNYKFQPLLVYFHGVISPEFKKVPTLKNYTGSPIEETGLIPFCRANKIALLVIEPFYSYKFLNCNARGWLIESELPGVEKIIDTVVEKYPIDRTNIFLAGISAGASFCHHLANRRPDFYAGIISHSQAFVSQEGELLEPKVPGPKFGVLFVYNKKDYPQLIAFCLQSFERYKQAGYKTKLIANVLPAGHSWSKINNRRFWKTVNSLKLK